MDKTLPGPVRLTLDQALAQWQAWSPHPTDPPRLVEVLRGGRSNTSVRVGDGSSNWVVRIDGLDAAGLGLNRDVEWQCLFAASAAGLAPKPVYRDETLGVLVCEHLPGAVGEPSPLEDIARLLRRIHALPPVGLRLDPIERAGRYLELAGAGEMPQELLAICRRLDEQVETTLCHNDLLAANRLTGPQGIVALDWEYAAMGDPLFDLAVIIEGEDLSESESADLHRLWRGAAPSSGERTRLKDQRAIYQLLAALWEGIPAPC